MRGGDRPDCVLVGTNEQDLIAALAEAEALREHSGAYRFMTANTVPFDGQRVGYMGLLSQALEHATGDGRPLSLNRMPNLALICLQAHLGRAGLRAERVNFFNAEKDRLAELLALDPPAVAISTTFYFSPDPVAEVVDFVRGHNPRTRIVVGGPYVHDVCCAHPQSLQDRLFERMGADLYVVEAQGEETLARLLGALAGSGGRLQDVPNLVIAGERPLRRTRREVENNDLDAGTVDWRALPAESVTPVAQVRTALSCPFRCAFCDLPRKAGRHRLMSVEEVERQLVQLRDLGVDQVVFVDDSFNVPLERFKAICRSIIRNRCGFQWFSYFRAGEGDDEAFDLMQRSGCGGVFLGVETADRDLLRAMSKRGTAESFGRTIVELERRGIFTFASLVIGFPGETEASVEADIEFLERYRPSSYRANLYYHSLTSPVQERAAHVGLRGAGYSWSHSTMSWREAADHVDRVYRTVEGSLILPQLGFNTWSLPYLMGEGLSFGQWLEFVEVAGEMLVKGLDGLPSGGPEDRGRLASIFEPAAGSTA